MNNEYYTVIVMLNENPESIISLGQYKTREDAEKNLKKAINQRKSFGSKYDYYYTKIVFNYFDE